MRAAIIAAVVAALVSSAGTFAANRFIITNAKQQISGRALHEIEPSVERGRRGPQGIQGYLGPFGPPGPAGPKGDKGTTGAVGNTIQGETGPKGSQGPEGKEGRKGATGNTGPGFITISRLCLDIEAVSFGTGLTVQGETPEQEEDRKQVQGAFAYLWNAAGCKETRG